MSFWFRYSFLILLCVITPLGLGFWMDTQSQLERAKAAGEAAAAAAEPALAAQLQLAAHARVGAALQLAQSVGDEKLLVPSKGALRPEAPARLTAMLAAEQDPGDGFVWVLDEQGAVVARRGAARPTDPDKLTGHPLFVTTQLGFATDGMLRLGDALFVVGAAPVTREGEAQGAVLLALPLDARLLTGLAGLLRTDITLAQKDDVLVSTLPTDIATTLLGGVSEGSEAVTFGGRLAKPLRVVSGVLPMFVAHDAAGIAYASFARTVVGQEDMRWVLSVENGRALDNLAERQQSILGVLLAALLASLVIGLSMARTFVRPIGLLTEHLSGLQQGRGEREISESQVSGPFRRLAKLINMTVQRIPPGGAFAFSESERRPSADPAPDLSQAMLSVPPAGGEGVPPAMTGSAPLNVAALAGRGASTSSTRTSAADAMTPAGPSMYSPTPPAPPAAALAPPVAPQAQPAASLAPVRAPSFTPRAEAALAEAAAADLMGGLGGPDLDSALAAAARAVDANFEPSSAASRKPRSASSVRGAPSTSVSQSMLDMNTSALQALGSARPEPPRAEPPRHEPARAEAPRADSVRGGNPFSDRSPFGAGAGESASPFGSLLEQAKAPTGGFNIPAAPTSSSRMGGSAAFGGGGFGFGSAGVPDEGDPHSDDFKSEATVVAAPNDYLLQASARDMTASGFSMGHAPPERTVVAEVPKNLIAESKKASSDLDDPEDMAHFKETYERFVDMRRQCGEPTGDLVFERFVAKLRKNREGLISKYNCRTVRFQVYEKDGKAALKATPVRA
jgi:hypothetical protein